jgi:hypothetical protein
VDPNSLVCDDDNDDDDAVCATNGVTYPSLCRLLQDTGNEAVAYAGECDREECQGGKVSKHSVYYETHSFPRLTTSTVYILYPFRLFQVKFFNCTGLWY